MSRAILIHETPVREASPMPDDTSTISARANLGIASL